MSEVSFLGVSKAQWELVNSFANWLAAIGTVAAVIVSLWLATRASRLSATASVGHRLIVGSQGSKFPEVVVFRIVNTGERPMRVTHIGWTIGFYKWKRNALQMHDQLQSSPLPVELSHGQEASWVVPLDAREEGWMNSFSRKMLLPNWRFSCATLRAQFATSVGRVFVVKPEASLVRRLRESCMQVQGGDA